MVNGGRGDPGVTVTASPSGSVAVISTSRTAPSTTVWFGIGSRTGGRSTFVTVIINPEVMDALEGSTALTPAEAVPASLNPGARWMLPVVAFTVVTVI